jgi:hypothetical protein
MVPSFTARVFRPPCAQTGEEAIADIGFRGATIADGVFGLLAVMAVLNVVAYFLLKFSKPKYQALREPPTGAKKA